MAFFVTYDVRQSHNALKDNLRKQGFIDCVTLNDGSRKRLPNTTMFHATDDFATVSRLFGVALQATLPNPGLEKLLYVPLTGTFNLISDANC